MCGVEAGGWGAELNTVTLTCVIAIGGGSSSLFVCLIPPSLQDVMITLVCVKSTEFNI
jgi:hypothetical protein